MDKGLPFRPVIGSNTKILNSTPTAGYVWFATDTKKIYYSDGDAFLSMGGNTGIYYGSLDTSEAEEDQEEFEFLLEHIEGNENVQDGNYKRPNRDDLILNLTDKCFYRVKNVLNNSSKFICEKITLSGGGGGTVSPGGNLKLRCSDPENKGFNRTFAQKVSSAVLQFIVNPPVGQTLENNQIESITYEIAGVTTVIESDVKEFGLQTFDLTPYLSKMNTSQTVNIKVRVYDAYSNRGDCTFYVNVINISLTSDINKTILLTSDENREISYRCTPIGGGTLTNRYINIYFYDDTNNKIETIREPASGGQEMPIIVKVPTIGTYTMEVVYSGEPSDGGETIYSNSLIYKVVAYNEFPQLIVGVPPKKVEQYSTVKIEYLVAMVTDSIEDITVTLTKNGMSTITKVKYNALNEWSIYFDSIGLYDLSVTALGVTKILPTIEVVQYSGTLPSVYNNGLTLNFTATNRSNDELNKDSWISTGTNKTVGFKFNNFAWGDINGWTKDSEGIDILHLSSGATLQLENYSPFAQNPMINGQTIELDFMISGVTDFSQPLIRCLSYDHEDKIQVGFNITGQESTLNTRLIKATGGSIIEGDSAENQVYNTQIQGLTAKFIENRRIHLTWVIENKDKLIAGNTKSYPMIKTYLNGVLSGITQYIATGTSADDSMSENASKPARLIFDSTYGNIDIYNIRIYEKSALNSNTVVSNYIATYGSAEDKTVKYEDNKYVLDSESNISVSTIETAHENYGYKLSLPYIKISGGSELIKNDDDGNYYLNTGTSEQRLPVGKKDYRTVDEMIFIDHNGKRPNFSQKSVFKEDGVFNGIVMYGQGTSSMEYPVKNLRFKSKLNINDKKFLFTINDNQVDLVCLKVDYMESSGSHNTGTGNLVQMLLDGIPRMKTPGQTKWTSNSQKTLTAIQGFPVAVFYKNSNDPDAPYEFIGKGNFNLDKATHEPFGFMSSPKTVPDNISNDTFGWDENDGTNCILGSTPIVDKIDYNQPKYISSEESPIINSIHCYEFLNNASNLANFKKEENETFEETFFKTVVSDGKKVPNWFTSYESRYPEGDAKDGSDINIAPFYRLCSWLNSTSQIEATNDLFETPIIINGVTYNKDTKEYRIAKFKNEFNQYLNLDFTLFYYVLTHVLLMIDSRAKNMMLATWDNKIWYPIFYDMDTMLGLNNYGYNKYNYDIEDSADNVYNEQNSALWHNVKAAFPDEIRSMYQEMQTAGLTYTKLLENYNKNQADAPNESIYNEDARYKYIRPFSEKYIGADGKWVNPGTKDFLYASQGSRSMHREWWLQNRINYFNGKYLSSEYKNDKYEMRLYTPSATLEFYYASIGTPLKEEFDEGLYYINIYENDNTKTPDYQLAVSWNPDTLVYYKRIEVSSQLRESLEAVPPNNNYILTPLYNQYLSIAYGGTNGQTTNPVYVPANTPQLIPAPSGNKFNDTETYVYGGSMIKDLGDLSTQYLGAFRFPDNVTKLESLTLGNRNNKYYNPNFSSLSIGEQAPYLAQLNIMNCIGLKGRALSLESCQNLQQLLATGTGLTSVSLPEYGVLNELRLPSTITTLVINNQTNLRSNFTIGTYNSDNNQYSYTGGRNISILDIQNTPIDTYRIVKECENALQRVRLTDFNWTIGQSQSQDIDVNNSSIKVLDILNKDNVLAIENDQGLKKSQTISGNITIDATTLNINITQAMALYNKYIKLFPNINFTFTGLNIYNVNILDGNGNVYWTKKIKEQDSITKDFLSDGPKGSFSIPKMQSTIQYIYTFNNKWHILNEAGGTLKSIDASQDEGVKGWPISDFAVGSDIYLKPDFSAVLQNYTIKIVNEFDGEFESEGTYTYGTSMKTVIEELEEGKVPYRDDTALKFNQTYRFLGYNTDNSATTALSFGEDYIVSGSNTYYAIFKEVSVYENVYSDYYNYEVGGYSEIADPSFNITEGVYITSPRKEIKGKITIPASAKIGNKEYPILGFKKAQYQKGAFENNKTITHVFFEKDNSIREIGEATFASAEKLNYIEFPENLRVIGKRAFQLTPLRPDPDINEPSFKLNSNLYSIGELAFNQCFVNYKTMIKFFVPASVVRMDRAAISNMFVKNSQIIIGDPSNYSKLDFTTSNSSEYRIIIQGSGEISTIEFYSLNYDANDDVIVGQYGMAKVENVIGQNADTVNVY